MDFVGDYVTMTAAIFNGVDLVGAARAAAWRAPSPWTPSPPLSLCHTGLFLFCQRSSEHVEEEAEELLVS